MSNSITCATLCVDCRLRAPELGRSGMMGFPSLAIRAGSMERTELYSFGWIYDGLSAICYEPLEVTFYRDFLQDHREHRLVLVNDPVTDFAEGAWRDWPSWKGDANGHRVGHYLVENETGERQRMPLHRFRDFERRPLAPADVTNFLTRLNPDTEESFFQVPRLLDPHEELGRLIEFFELFGDTALTVELI